jgi:hypothetical protein
MSSAPIHRIAPVQATLPGGVPASGSSKRASTAHRPPPKKRADAAWALWKADGSASSGAEFLRSVSSWTEGTTAQLLRPQWPAAVRRPTSPEVQERLRHHLGLAVRGEHATYRDALGWARDAVIEELREARSPAGGNEAGVADG